MKYLGLVVVGVTACASVEHTPVTNLPPNPAPNQRMWFWEAYRPRGRIEEIITVCRGAACSSTHNTVIQSADGRTVRDPSDLAPLVAPDSRTVTEAQHAASLHRTARWLWAATIVGLAAGMVIGADGNDSGNTPEIEAGIGISLGSLLVGGISANIVGRHARKARDRAFDWYPHDLAEQLHVCFNGVNAMPCEMITTGTPPPPAPRDPNLDDLRQR